MIDDKIAGWHELWKSGSIPGTGASSTKLVYLWCGGAGTLASFLMTIAFCGHAFYTKKADLIFAGAVAAMWTTLFGFATSAQKNKANAEAAPVQDTKP